MGGTVNPEEGPEETDEKSRGYTTVGEKLGVKGSM
jgi:hypothetical protein